VSTIVDTNQDIDPDSYSQGCCEKSTGCGEDPFADMLRMGVSQDVLCSQDELHTQMTKL